MAQPTRPPAAFPSQNGAGQQPYSNGERGAGADSVAGPGRGMREGGGGGLAGGGGWRRAAPAPPRFHRAVGRSAPVFAGAAGAGLGKSGEEAALPVTGAGEGAAAGAPGAMNAPLAEF